jgi:hypothetical protein
MFDKVGPQLIKIAAVGDLTRKFQLSAPAVTHEEEESDY